MTNPHLPDFYPPLDPTAVLWSKTSNGGYSNLLVMMHGWGYDERHLFALQRFLPAHLTIASVRAPLPEAGGYAWFPSSANPVGNPQPWVANSAAAAVLAWLDQLPRYRSVGLMGFAQGGAMVLQLMRHRPDAFRYGVQLGGFVVDDTQPGDARLSELLPPVFWGRGAVDSVIPASAVDRTSKFSASHLTVSEHVYPDLGHEITGPEIDDLASFVAQHNV